MKKLLLLFITLLFCFTVFGQIAFQEIAITGYPNSIEKGYGNETGDLDGDGYSDLIMFDPRMYWFKNTNGSGKFSYVDLISYYPASSVKTNDIDNDGDLDIIAAIPHFPTNDDYSLVWLKNTDGLGNFSTENLIVSFDYSSFGDDERITSFDLSDLDGDNDIDIVIGTNKNNLVWVENLNGINTFSDVQTIDSFTVSGGNSYGIRHIDCKDLDNDGYTDIVIGVSDLIWYKNIDGNGTFSDSQIIYTSASTNINNFICEDIDNDGDVDLVIVDNFNNKLYWYSNTGVGTFSSNLISNNYGGSVISASDIDNDEDIDIIVTRNSASIFNDNSLFRNDGNGNFVGEECTNDTSIYGVFDVNNDDLPDIIHSNVDKLTEITINENGIVNSSNNRKIISFDITDGISVSQSDLDNDGDIDILTSSEGKIAWFENSGNENYKIQHTLFYKIYTDNHFVLPIDIDNDGDIDIIGSSNANNRNLMLFKNLGQGEFELDQIIENNINYIRKIISEDIDSDGDKDIIITSSSDNKIVWYENLDGLGNFGSENIISDVLYNAELFKVIDFDGDNDFDIVALSYDDDKIIMYENLDSLGNFSSEIVLYSSAQQNLKYFEIKDIDSNGTLDIVVHFAGSLIWLSNDGLGNFVSHTIINSNVSFVGLKVLDIDNDNDLDVVAYGGSAVWYENLDGNGTFDTNEKLITQDNLNDFSTININNDGDYDFVGINGNKVNLYKNVGVLGNQISGNILYDIDNDGCDQNDLFIENIMLNSNNGVENFATFSVNGIYQNFVNEGNFVTSISQLPNYYTSNPNSVTSNFLDLGNIDIVNFCIEPIGTINDLNISVYPSINDPRPGFNTTYKIVYNNVGTTQLNGDVTFQFDDAKLNFLNVSETITSQTANSLTFNFTDLNPFETRTIDLEFNVFTPPTTNIDDVLVATATVNPVSGDNTSEDNVFELNQTVIGSYDPNDIRVLEGEEILLADADKYLHYIIRFQNTGTASAINVNVENVLDSKLDWTTMKLERLSHTGRVEITDGSMVKFIFSNINLPDSTSDEPNSHGFIAYKIKPKDNVVVGDIFNSTADIFFDFNPAIVTNTVSTEIVASLSVEEFETTAFSIYPNPTNNILNIEGKAVFDVVTIYDINGRLLKTVTFSSNKATLDVTNLSQGLYFIEINSGKSKETLKFVKK